MTSSASKIMVAPIALTELASGLIITEEPAEILPDVNELLKLSPPVVVFRIDHPVNEALMSPILLISKNSSLVVELFSSNMNRLNKRSSGPTELVVSGSGCPGVGQGRASPKPLIVLQSVVMVHDTKSTSTPSGSSIVKEPPRPLMNQFGILNTTLSPGAIIMLDEFQSRSVRMWNRSPSSDNILQALKSIISSPLFNTSTQSSLGVMLPSEQ